MSMREEDSKIRPPRAAARAQGLEDDPRWPALTDGTLSPEEVAALRAEAEETEEGRALWELYHPCDEKEQERIFQGMRDRLGAPEQEAERAQDGGAADRTAPAPPEVGRVLSLHGARRRKLAAAAGVAAVVAMAAAAVLWLGAPLRPGAPLPAVEVAWAGDRGPEPKPATLSTPDSELTETIAPLHPVAGKLAVRGTLLLRDGVAHAWSPTFNPPSPVNEIYLAGTRKSLFPCVGPGTWEMIVAVGLPGPPLEEGELRSRAGKPSAGSYQVLRRRVELEGPAVDAEGAPCRAGSP